MKPKILFILHIPPPIHGAAIMGTYIQNSTLINSYFDTAFINLSTSGTINEIGKGKLSKIFALFKIIISLLKALLFTNFNLCYMTLSTRGYGFYKDFLLVIILKLFRKKIIYHFHNKGVRTKQHKKLDNLLYSFTFKDTKSILLSPLLYNDIAKYVRTEDVFYCANGIPEIYNHSTMKGECNKKNNPCTLLFLSNMIVEKGVMVLLDACKLLKKNNSSFECHFVGEWASVSEDDFKQYVAINNLSDCIFSHGKKYNEEKLAFFCSSHVFVLPTFNECFPLVLLEAMQFQLPVVSTNEGGIAEIISDGVTGFIVPHNNPIKLADTLRLLINNAELISQMGAAGKKRFQEKFTIKHFEDRMLTILKQAVKS